MGNYVITYFHSEGDSPDTFVASGPTPFDALVEWFWPHLLNRPNREALKDLTPEQYERCARDGRVSAAYRLWEQDTGEHSDGYCNLLYLDLDELAVTVANKLPLEAKYLPTPWNEINELQCTIAKIEQSLKDADKLLSLQDLPGMAAANPTFDLTPARKHLDDLKDQLRIKLAAWEAVKKQAQEIEDEA